MFSSCRPGGNLQELKITTTLTWTKVTKNPFSEESRGMMLALRFEPLCVAIQESVQKTRSVQRHMAKAQCKLSSTVAESASGLKHQVYSSRQAGAIRALPAMEKDRVLGAIQHSHESPDLGDGWEAVCRKRDILLTEI
jgi:hypothetical protein